MDNRDFTYCDDFFVVEYIFFSAKLSAKYSFTDRTRFFWRFTSHRIII